MNFGIIAAGKGSRLLSEGVSLPKPLVDMDGRPMIGRLIDIFVKCGASSVCVVVNEDMEEVKMWLKRLRPSLPCRLEIIVKTTPSSMHSFHEIAMAMEGRGRYIVTTVDSIFREKDFSRFVETFSQAPDDVDGMMAVTPFVDDEKPLYVEVGAEERILGFYDNPRQECGYVSGGIYALPESALPVLEDCMARGVGRMRNFQRALVEHGFNLRAFPVAKIMDVDHAEDIAKACDFIRLSKIRIAAVMRREECSPGNVVNDAAILNAVATALENYGCEVNVYSEAQFITADIGEDVIVNMCRTRKAVEKLQRLENEGKLVVNSGFGIENCMRERMTRILVGNRIPYPESLVVDTCCSDVADQLKRLWIDKCWVKRGDCHAIQKEDVCFCSCPEEVNSVLKDFSERGIRRAVISQHLRGDLIKFYGVADTPFFFWFYPADEGHSKFGYESVNGESDGICFDEDDLKKICRRAADLLELKIYGGDCVVEYDDSLNIIDFNDWPSFSPCRDEAAPCIAECVIAQIRQWYGRRPRAAQTGVDGKKTAGFKDTLKSMDTEEKLDLVFYRRIGYVWAVIASRLGITPNAITVAGIFLGVCAGIAFYFSDFRINILGAILLVLANSFDSADGQLARMTHQYSRLGRILDGISGDIWFVVIYAAICLRENHTDEFFMIHPWLIWAIAAITGLCHSIQASMADYYRQFHLFFIKGNEGSELDTASHLRHRLSFVSRRRDFWRWLFLSFYTGYTGSQEKRTPQMQRLRRDLKTRYGEKIPPDFRNAFRKKSLPLMKYTNILSFNTRCIALFAAILVFRTPWLYFAFELTVLNAVLGYMIWRHERICRDFAVSFETKC